MGQNSSSSADIFISTGLCLIIWGFLSPLLSFQLLKRFTRLDCHTISAVAASFGSVSVMTFISAISFLELIHVDYEKFIISVLAIMEIPAIISGVFLAQIFDPEKNMKNASTSKALKDSIFNKAIISIFSGILIGTLLSKAEINTLNVISQQIFKPILSIFLLDLGLKVGSQRNNFHLFTKALASFGLYMPLIGGTVGLIVSYLLKLDVGTGTLVAIISASSSYIAVPAAVRIALPEAKEAIYLPLSLGIAFPFNVIIGIPLYYYIYLWILKTLH